MREKSLGVHGDYGNFRIVLYTQNRLRKRQNYLSVHGEHNSEPISANILPNPEKILIQNHLTGHDRMGK
jgi:hypothetical protein